MAHYQRLKYKQMEKVLSTSETVQEVQNLGVKHHIVNSKSLEASQVAW